MSMKGLYPPIMDTYMPAFKVPQSGETLDYAIKYQLSPLNSGNEIKYVQMTIVNQATNQSVYKLNSYPNGIKMQLFNGNSISVKLGASGDIEANPGDIYKVQIRFVSSQVGAPSNQAAPDAKWLNDNLNYFSEWSTVCLITFIDAPKITIKSFDNEVKQNNKNAIKVKTGPNVFLVASFSCTYDALKSYKVSLWGNGKQLESSEIKYDSSITYSFNTEVQDNKTYVIKIEYTTKKYYTETLLYNIIANTGEDSGTLSYSKIISYVNRDEDQMVINCKIDSKDLTNFQNATLIIKRADHLTNFTKWSVVHKANATSAIQNYFWADNTVDSGVWYKYALCFEFNKGSSIHQSAMVKEEEPSMMILNGVSLLGDGRMLKISFDPKVGVTPKSSSSVTETIGGRYPFIRKNGDLKYKQLSISGLITRHMDAEGLFISKDDLYNSYTEAFQSYNKSHRINEYNDLTYEKIFREAVMEFLTDGRPKLFRSATEGSILIQLTDVSITPNDQLGRMIYSFSATAYEIDEANIENYDRYDIQNIKNPNYETLSVGYKQNPDGTTKIVLQEQITDADGYASLNSSTFINGSGNYVLILDKKMS